MEELSQGLQGILPYFLIGGSNDIYMRMMGAAFIIMPFVMKFYYYIRKIISGNNTSVEIIAKLKNRYSHMHEYTKYVDAKKQIDSVFIYIDRCIKQIKSIEKFTNTNFILDSTNDYDIQIYKPTGKYSFKFFSPNKQKNYAIEFSYHTNETNVETELCLSLLSESREVVMEFLNISEKYYDTIASLPETGMFILQGGNERSYSWIYTKHQVNKTFENIFIELDVEDIIKNSLDTHIKNEKVCTDMGIPHKMSYIFYGEPGCGKSSMCYAIGRYLNKAVYHMKIDSDMELPDIKELFSTIHDNSVVVLEDIDTCCAFNTFNDRSKKKKKKSSDDFDKQKVDPKDLFNLLLEVFDGYKHLHGCVLILTTNYIDKIDPAIIRPGRINFKIEFKKPSNVLIIKIFNKFFKEFSDIHRNSILDLSNKLAGKITTATLINEFILPNIYSFDNCAEKLNIFISDKEKLD